MCRPITASRSSPPRCAPSASRCAGWPAKDVSLGQMLDGLFKITRDFDMPTQPHLLLLQKTMVMEEGVATALDPDINMWETAEPFLTEWVRSELGPEARIADEIVRTVRTLRRLPELIRRIDHYYPPPGAAPPAPPLREIAVVRPASLRPGRADRPAVRRGWRGGGLVPSLGPCRASASSSSSAAGSRPTRRASSIRLIRKAGGSVRCVLTAGGAQFVTPMTLAALSEQPVHTSLWDLKDEVEMGHIQLSREADLVVVCPATADLLAKMAAGIADDLATTLLLATDKKVLAAPAMNVRMWQHEATRRNVARLRADGVAILEPDEGEMACGEYGPGRLPEPEAILAAIEAALGGPGPLAGKHVIVTAGPTHEPIDPVRDHRQPLVGQAGLRHRRRARRARREGHARRRPGVARHAGRRCADQCRDRAADGRRRPRRPPRRRRGAGRRGRRLAGRARARQAQEGGRAAGARLAAHGRHPRQPRRQPGPAEAR